MMTRTRIKICGMTDVDEALELASLGVDALGFIFVKESPRYVEPERVKEIVRKLPPFVDTVGVFMNEEPDLLNDIVQYCALDVVQLHGFEPPEYCEAVSDSSRLIKVFGVGDGGVVAFEPYAGLVKGFLLDTCHKGQSGGTGKTFDWGLAAKLSLPGPLILAGGLAPDNVAEAIRQTRPFAVDVNSGVEFEPGRKDVAEVKRLLDEVKRADSNLVSAP